MSFLCKYVPAIFIVFLIIFITTYVYFKYKYNYFRKQSIPFLAPTFPLGSIKLSIFLQFGQDIGKLYAELRKKKVKYGGYYLLMKPVIMLIHPDIFKPILIKNFNHFRDRGIYSNEEKEFITSHLVTLNGHRWKPIRPKLAPLFSTSNLKDMADVLAEKSSMIEKRLDEFVNTSTPIESKDLSARIIIECICSILYGIETNGIINSNADIPNYGLKIVRNNVYHSVKLIVANTLPFIFNKLNINFIKTDVQNFLIRIFSEAIDYREKKSVERKDLLNLLLKMKKEITSEITNDEGNGKPIAKLTKKQMIAHCFVFFLGGFNTSSTATSFCLYELTQNSDIQNKLREEIWCVLKKYDYKLSYEAIKEMKYLDKVVSGTDSVIEKGTSVMISLLGLHHDPEFYPEPEKFDPERFSEDEKARRHPYAYLPFGAGPRGCIAKRLGLLQTKICLVALLKNYKYNLNPNTKLPLKFKTDAVFLVTDGEIWIDVVKV